MKRLDRIIMVVFLVGVWGLLGTIWLKPSNVDAHADGHTHYSFELFDVAEEGHSHDYAENSGKAIIENQLDITNHKHLDKVAK